LTVIGSEHRLSVEAQLSLVRLRIWTAKARRSGGDPQDPHLSEGDRRLVLGIVRQFGDQKAMPGG
jgi:hypothetical protein